jgi:hypothetical protein
MERVVMPVVQKIREALRLSELKLPKNPQVVDVQVEEYVDTSGEDALRVLVILDEGVKVEKLSGDDISNLKMEIRRRIRAQGVDLWPYIFLAKRSELDQGDSEE